MTEEKSAAKLRQKELFLKKENGYDKMDEASLAGMNEYCESYKHFLDNAKTEREAVKAAISLARASTASSTSGPYRN